MSYTERSKYFASISIIIIICKYFASTSIYIYIYKYFASISVGGEVNYSRPYRTHEPQTA